MYIQMKHIINNRAIRKKRESIDILELFELLKLG